LFRDHPHSDLTTFYIVIKALASALHCAILNSEEVAKWRSPFESNRREGELFDRLEATTLVLTRDGEIARRNKVK
jgi:hypothetical protein